MKFFLQLALLLGISLVACEETEEQCTDPQQTCGATPATHTPTPPQTLPAENNPDSQEFSDMALPTPPDTARTPDATSTPNMPDGYTETDLGAESTDTLVTQLTCARAEENPAQAMLTFTGTANIEVMVLSAWHRLAKGCNVYRISRETGYDYLVLVIPRDHTETPEEWLSKATIGNHTQPQEALTPHANTLAYLYTSTDLGVPKIYALVWTPNFAVYVEWQSAIRQRGDDLLRATRQQHLIFEIPEDLRDFVSTLQ